MVRLPGADERREIVVLAGGEPLDGEVELPHAVDRVIAADSGLGHAAGLGLAVDLVVGDMDSVAPELLAAAERDGAQIRRFPPDKDATDLEIALDVALEHAPARVTIVGGHGGRLDHLLANLALLASPRYAPLGIVARMGEATVTVVHDEVELTGRVGEMVSLVPLHGAAQGVTTEGLRFPLHDEDLLPEHSRGVSNELIAEHAGVRLRGGVLLAIQPGHPNRTD